MSYKPHLKGKKQNTVVLITAGKHLNCTEPTKELSFDRTQNAHDIIKSLEEQAATMQGVTIRHRTDPQSKFITHYIVDIESSPSNNAPRFIVLTLGPDPQTPDREGHYHVTEVETYMRTYGIKMDDAFDRSLNVGSA
ncbi:Uncharacterised protein [uncultured archaeon]|nr:Uncharacterised protein [uncultured archaeon]